MKFVHVNIERQIRLDGHTVCEWIIESPELFSKYVQELYVQSQGAEGSFVLSENAKELNISKTVEIIVNPFTMNFNDKKILNKLYTELSELAVQEEMYLLTQEMLGGLQKYLIQLEQFSPYILQTDLEINISEIFKAIGVKVGQYEGDFLERLIQYIKVLEELMRKRVVVLVNIRSYINDRQLEQLIETVKYNEITLLLIENTQKGFSKGLDRYIIDKDGCEIF